MNKIICGDCLEVMKDIPDKSIDLLITDPPYSIGTTSNGVKGNWLDTYYKANNIRPRPFKDVEIAEDTKGNDSDWDNNKGIIKDWLTKKKGMFKVK